MKQNHTQNEIREQRGTNIIMDKGEIKKKVGGKMYVVDKRGKSTKNKGTIRDLKRKRKTGSREGWYNRKHDI